MAIDYAALAADAVTLVEEAGREVTFIQYNQTPASGSEPWKGPSDARAEVVQEHILPAVAVDPSSAQRLGMSALPEDLLRRANEILIVAPGASFTGDLRLAHEAVDESARWGVLHVEQLKPANVLLLYFVVTGR